MQLYFNSWQTQIQIYCFLEGTNPTLLKKNKATLRFQQECWHQQSSRAFGWQHICYIWWMSILTDSRRSYVYQLCLSSPRLVPLFIWRRHYAGVLQENKRTSHFFYVHVYIDIFFILIPNLLRPGWLNELGSWIT